MFELLLDLELSQITKEEALPSNTKVELTRGSEKMTRFLFRLVEKELLFEVEKSNLASSRKYK